MNGTVLAVNLLSASLMPPLSLVLLCCAGLLLRRRAPRAGNMLSAVALGLLVVLMERSLREDFKTPVQWKEERSNTTAENAQFSSRILNAAGIKRILLVTDAMHMPRSTRVFEAAGLEVVPAPTIFFSFQQLTPLDFIPNGGAMYLSHYAMHEWIGLLWYRLRHGAAKKASEAA